MTQPFDEFLSEWTAAECAGDIERLATLLTEDFYGVGPLGFVLPRSVWLGRHRQGLSYEAFELDEVDARLYGDVGLVTARHNTRGTYQGQPLPEAVRATLVITCASRIEHLAAVHMTFIAGTQGAPAIPGSAPPGQTREPLLADWASR